MRDRLLGALLVVPFVIGATMPFSQASGEQVFRFQDPAIVESSALVVQDGLFITTNDSGDRGRVFAVDPATGRTVGVTEWAEEPTDVEALAPGGHGTVWVGDLGDNTHGRDSVCIARVPVGRGDRTVHPPCYPLTYPDGARDAETLLRNPATGRLYVVDKNVFRGTLYAVPRRLSAHHANRLRAVGSVLSLATDGSFFPDGRHLVLRDYVGAIVYRFPSLQAVARLALPAQQQGEGIAVAADGRVYVSSEGQDQPVLRAPLPPAVRREVAAPSPSPTSTEPPSTRALPGNLQASDPSVQQPYHRDAGQWLLGGLLAVVALVVGLLALRPR
ncbi:MAG: PQQ-binding-like beta-propeller repeat protein [Nocardioides sp.]